MIRPPSSESPPSPLPVSPGSAAWLPAAQTPLPGGAARSPSGGLDFSGWHPAGPVPTVRGERPYPGNPVDALAVADTIASLLFDRG